MSYYRVLVGAIVAFSLAATAFAADVNSNNTMTNTDQSQQTSATIQSSAEQPKSAKVNVNTATVKELMKVKGLNRAKSKNIIAYRKKNGDFKSLDDLNLVKGFKKIKAEQLKLIQDQLSL